MTFASEKLPVASINDLQGVGPIDPIDVEMDEFKRIEITDMSLLSGDIQEFEEQLANSIEKWKEMKPRYV